MPRLHFDPRSAPHRQRSENSIRTPSPVVLTMRAAVFGDFSDGAAPHGAP